jgi:hypothetical protein
LDKKSKYTNEIDILSNCIEKKVRMAFPVMLHRHNKKYGRNNKIIGNLRGAPIRSGSEEEETTTQE